MAKPIVYISIILIFVFLLLAGYLCYNQAQLMEDDEDNRKYVLYFSYFLFGVTFLYVILMLCLCSRIRLAIAIFQVTSDFMRDTPSIFFVPIFFLFVSIIFMFVWIVSAIYIFTVGEAKPRENLSTFSTV